MTRFCYTLNKFTHFKISSTEVKFSQKKKTLPIENSCWSGKKCSDYVVPFSIWTSEKFKIRGKSIVYVILHCPKWRSIRVSYMNYRGVLASQKSFLFFDHINGDYHSSPQYHSNHILILLKLLNFLNYLYCLWMRVTQHFARSLKYTNGFKMFVTQGNNATFS